MLAHANVPVYNVWLINFSISNFTVFVPKFFPVALVIGASESYVKIKIYLITASDYTCTYIKHYNTH